MKCTFKDCPNEGEPNKGFDFYACDSCLDELSQLIDQKYEEMQYKAYERAQNN